jgi:hypothetical protein
VAQEHPIIQIEVFPPDQTRTMGRGPRLDPELYNVLKEKIPPLGDTATRLTLPEGTSLTAMKNRIPGRSALRDVLVGPDPGVFRAVCRSGH